MRKIRRSTSLFLAVIMTVSLVMPVSAAELLSTGAADTILEQQLSTAQGQVMLTGEASNEVGVADIMGDTIDSDSADLLVSEEEEDIQDEKSLFDDNNSDERDINSTNSDDSDLDTSGYEDVESIGSIYQEKLQETDVTEAEFQETVKDFPAEGEGDEASVIGWYEIDDVKSDRLQYKNVADAIKGVYESINLANIDKSKTKIILLVEKDVSETEALTIALKIGGEVLCYVY